MGEMATATTRTTTAVAVTMAVIAVPRLSMAAQLKPSFAKTANALTQLASRAVETSMYQVLVMIMSTGFQWSHDVCSNTAQFVLVSWNYVDTDETIMLCSSSR